MPFIIIGLGVFFILLIHAIAQKYMEGRRQSYLKALIEKLETPPKPAETNKTLKTTKP